MLQEIIVGGIIISTDSDSGDTFFNLSNPKTGEIGSIDTIPKKHHFLVFTLLKLLILELKDKDEIDIATISNRIMGAEEMLINILEVLVENGYIPAGQVNQFLKLVEGEYKQVGIAVFGRELVRQYLRNTSTPSTGRSRP